MKVIGINKTQMVRDLLKSQPNLKPKQIAEAVDCDVTIVYEQRRKALKQKQVEAKKQKRSSVEVVSDGIAEASAILAELAALYNLSISIFEGKVLINKADMDYECAPADVPALLGTLAYLNAFIKHN